MVTKHHLLGPYSRVRKIDIKQVNTWMGICLIANDGMCWKEKEQEATKQNNGGRGGTALRAAGQGRRLKGGASAAI